MLALHVALPIYIGRIDAPLGFLTRGDRLAMAVDIHGVGHVARPIAARPPDDIARAQIVSRQNPQERASARSEEHTSAIQSLMRISYAVFCLNQKTKKK